MGLDERVSLNLNVRGLNLSATLASNERSAEIEQQGRRISRLGLGQSPFPVPDPVVEALRLHAHEKDYLPVRGLRELREAVASFHRDKDHVDVDAEGVLVGPGSKELMFLAQLAFYGEILIPTPCWVSYTPQAEILGRAVKLIHTHFEDRWKIAPERLDGLLSGEQDTYRPRMLVLNYPSNPHGGSYSAGELEEIAKVSRRYEVIVLSDEIYGQLHYRGEHVSIARSYPEGTIISSGLSKWCGAGGWRLGTFAFPARLRWLMDAMAAVASETYTSVSAPIQYAAVRAFQGGIKIERYLWHARRILEALGQRCADILAEIGVRVHRPVGGFYLFVDFSPLSEPLAARGIRSGAALCERLLEEAGVAVLPGEEFDRPAEELSLRVAFVNFDGSEALAASETTPLDESLPDSFLDTWCEETVSAVERIADWTRSG
ncbi:MAG: aminotransferase class I/II-fold pyridoxal phosphate-dependent enzyme [Deltaproteobacteria bacterium]|nr:aminotransferase class I/II-fold pyridoxal phosphate-dependent enzyme [Deltaproteobacteria bacterium]